MSKSPKHLVQDDPQIKINIPTRHAILSNLLGPERVQISAGVYETVNHEILNQNDPRINQIRSQVENAARKQNRSNTRTRTITTG